MKLTFDTMREWLLPLVPAVRNPPPADQFEMHAMACAIACAELPAEAFDCGSRQAALRHFIVWPAVAEVYAFIVGRVVAEGA